MGGVGGCPVHLRDHVILDRAAIGDLSSAVAVPTGTATAEDRSPAPLRCAKDDVVATF